MNKHPANLSPPRGGLDGLTPALARHSQSGLEEQNGHSRPPRSGLENINPVNTRLSAFIVKSGPLVYRQASFYPSSAKGQVGRL